MAEQQNNEQGNEQKDQLGGQENRQNEEMARTQQTEERSDEAAGQSQQQNSDVNMDEFIQNFEKLSMEQQHTLLPRIAEVHAKTVQQATMKEVVSRFTQALQNTLQGGQQGQQQQQQGGQEQQGQRQGQQQGQQKRRGVRGRRPTGEGMSLEDVIQSVVSKHPEGMRVGDIFQQVQSEPRLHTNSSGENLKNLVRNYLSKLTRKQVLERKAGAVYAPKQQRQQHANA